MFILRLKFLKYYRAQIIVRLNLTTLENKLNLNRVIKKNVLNRILPSNGGRCFNA